MINDETDMEIKQIKEKIQEKCQQSFKGKREAFRFFDHSKVGVIMKIDFCS